MQLGLGSKAKLGPTGIEDDVLALQENITKDREANSSVRLQTTKAGSIARGAVVHQRAGHGGLVATDANAEIGKGGRAGEDISTGVVVILSTANLRVILRDNGVVEKQQSSAGVGNSVETGARSASSGVTVHAEAPESLGAVHVGVHDRAGIFGGVSEAEVIDTGLTVLQGNSEQGLSERALDVVK